MTEWPEHDESILDSWHALRSELRMFLHVMSYAIDILVAHFSSLDKRAESFSVGWREPDFLFTNVHELQTKREIIEPQRFLYSKAMMEPDANTKSDDKLHAEFEAAYRRTMPDPVISEECKKGLKGMMNFHQNKRHKTSK